jgi:beta-1,4-mannosyltransferase
VSRAGTTPGVAPIIAPVIAPVIAPAALPVVALAADGGRRLLNPYLRLIFGSTAFAEGASVGSVASVFLRPGVRNLHLHWPEYPLHGRLARRSEAAADAAYALLVGAADRIRRRGGRVVWTAHNLAPHGFPAPWGPRAYARWAPRLLARADTVVAMSSAAAAAVRAALPDVAGARFALIPHPHYREVYGTPDPSSIRARHGIPAGAHLTVAAGLVRPYKGIPALVAAFAAAARDDEWLLVAGPCHDPAHAAEVARAVAAAGPRVRLALGPLDDAGFAAALAAGDLFAGNFDTVLNSGSVIAALSLDRPVLAPRSAPLAELRDQVGAAWLSLFDAPLDRAKLRRHLDALRSTARTGRPDLEPNDPAAVARAHLALYT